MQLHLLCQPYNLPFPACIPFIFHIFPSFYYFLDYNLFNVTLHEKTTLENSSLTLVKEKLPNSYDLSLILEDNINVYPSLQNVFSSYPSLWINGKEIDNIVFGYPEDKEK